MIALRRADERRYHGRRRQEAWLTFSAGDRDDPLVGGFGALRMLNEDRLPPGARLSHPQHDSEIVTYVREGALTREDSVGRSSIIQAGEFRCASTGQGGRYTETNLSRTAWAHVFQLWVCPSALALEPSDEQKRFSSAERRGILRVVASPDARRGSLLLHQNALLFSAMLDPGQHVVHELAQGRSAWLHIVRGDATLGDIALTTGDGVGVRAERAVSLTARGGTELLLLDFADPPARPSLPS